MNALYGYAPDRIPNQLPIYNGNYTDYSGYANGTTQKPTQDSSGLNYYTPYQTTIAGQRIAIGDPSVTNDAQAIAYLRNQYQPQATTGSIDPTYWQALNPGMSAQDMQAYQALRNHYVKSTSFDSLANHLGPWPGIVGLAAVGAGAAGAAGAAGGAAGSSAGSGVGMAAGGGALSSDAALGAAVDAGVGTFGSGAAAAGAAGVAGAGAGAGFGAAGTGGLPANLATDFAGTSAGSGATGALASSGGIAGGAGTGGTTAGALGSFSGAANAVSGAGGGSMGTTSLWQDLVPLAVSAFNSYQQNQGAKSAAAASVKGQQAGIDEQRRQFDIIMGMLQPQQQFGTNSLNTLSRLNGYNTGANGAPGAPDMSAFTASPDYNFRRDEGTRNIENSFAARGGALSGNALRGITDYNSNLASGEYNNFYQRQLQGAGLGGAATSQGVNAAQYTGGNVSNLLNQQGNARASGVVDSTNAITGGLNDLSTWYGNWLKNRQQPAYGG